MLASGRQTAPGPIVTTEIKPLKTKKSWREIRDDASVASLGLEIGLSILAGWYLGYLFDSNFESAPWGQIFFLVAGMGAGVKAIIRTVKVTKKVMMRPEPGVAAAAEYDRRRLSGAK